MNTLLKFEVHTRADCLAAFFDSDGSPCIQIFVKAGRKTLALFSGGALSQQINNTSRSEQFGPRWRINSAAACDGRRLHTAGRCRHFVPISFRLHVNKLPLLPLWTWAITATHLFIHSDLGHSGGSFGSRILYHGKYNPSIMIWVDTKSECHPETILIFACLLPATATAWFPPCASLTGVFLS